MSEIQNPFRVLQVMDYYSAYPGNFMHSIKALEVEIHKSGGILVYVMPEAALRRDWVLEMQAAGKNMRFLSGNTVKDALLIRKLVKQFDINIIHSHFATRRLYLPIRIARIGNRRIPHFFHAHSQPKRGEKPFLDFIRNRLIDETLYICVGESVAAPYSARGRKCAVVRNAVDFSRLEQFQQLDRSEYLIKPSNRLLLMLGYDFQIKGIDVAIKALQKYDKGHEWILLICVASRFERAKEQAADLLGEIPSWLKLVPPRNDIASYFRLADVFLSASRTEGIPYALLEAAYCGTPVAASDIPGQKELKIPYKAEFECENEEELYTAVASLLSRPEETARRESAEAKEYIKQSFAMDRWTGEILKLYADNI